MTEHQAHTAATEPVAKPKRGRRTLPATEKKKGRSVRLKPAQWAMFDALGGNPWLEDMIEAAHKHLPAAQKENPPN